MMNEWARQEAALTHPNLICQQANPLFAMGIAHTVKSGCNRKKLYQTIRHWAVDMTVEPALLDTIQHYVLPERPVAGSTRRVGTSEKLKDLNPSLNPL